MPPGKRANLLLLRKDPAQTVEAYDEIVKVILRGRVIDRAELVANRTPDGDRSRSALKVMMM